jgi:hypothetical protein
MRTEEGPKSSLAIEAVLELLIRDWREERRSRLDREVSRGRNGGGCLEVLGISADSLKATWR